MIRFWLAAILLLASGAALADPIRIATFNTSLSKRGPGVLLDKIISDKDKQIIAVSRIIKTVRPDILLINELDHDYENLALKAFLKLLAQDDGEYSGIHYPYFFAPPQNTGVPSGLDLNGDGKLGGPADAFGYGKFRGQYAMALISRFPIDVDHAADWAKFKWRDLSFGKMPVNVDGTDFPSSAAQDIMRFSSKGHWIVPIILPDGRVLQLMASHPTPPVFDGPEDMNGLRNRDEILFWPNYINGTVVAAGFDGDTPYVPKSQHYVVLGDMNSDPVDGDGAHDAIDQLIQVGLLQDPLPTSKGAVQAARDQGQANRNHKGDPALDTADFRDDPGPGNLRVDYVLPSRTLTIVGAGVFWPAPDQAGFDLIGSDGRASSDHRLVWLDVE